MTIKQISAFLENKPGRLVEVTKSLKDHGIDIRSLNVADTTNFGILRIIVNDPDKTENILKSEGFTVKVSEVIGVEIKDRPGGLNDALVVLDNEGLDLRYMYAFIGKMKDSAYVVIKAENNEKAATALSNAGFKLLEQKDIENL